MKTQHKILKALPLTVSLTKKGRPPSQAVATLYLNKLYPDNIWAFYRSDHSLIATQMDPRWIQTIPVTELIPQDTKTKSPTSHRWNPEEMKYRIRHRQNPSHSPIEWADLPMLEVLVESR